MEFSFGFPRSRALRAFLSKISPSATDQLIEPHLTSTSDVQTVEHQQLPSSPIPQENEPQQSPAINVLQEKLQELPAITALQGQEQPPPSQMPERAVSNAATTAPVYVVISDSEDNGSDDGDDKADVIAISSDENAPEDSDDRSDTRSTPSVRAGSVEYMPPEGLYIPAQEAPQEDMDVSMSAVDMDLDSVVAAEQSSTEAVDDDIKSIVSEEGSFDDEYEYGDDELMDGEQEVSNSA